MRITEIREAVLPAGLPYGNAIVSFARASVAVVAVVSDVIRGGAPLVGYGYSVSSLYAPGEALRERVIPRLRKADPEALLDERGSAIDPLRAHAIMLRGDKQIAYPTIAPAVGTVDMALWDLAAKVEGKPLAALLAARFGTGAPRTAVPLVAAAGFLSPQSTRAELEEDLRSCYGAGFTTLKIKVGGGSLVEDLRRIEAALTVVGGGKRLAVDANGRFDLATARAYAEALAPYGLRWYEEPVHPLDFAGHAELADSYGGPLATGENLSSPHAAGHILHYGGLRADRDVLMLDCVLCGGVPAYLAALREAEALGWPREQCVPHGGHLLTLQLVAGLGLGGSDWLAAQHRPFDRLPDDVELVDGVVRLPEREGIGVESVAELHALLRRTLELEP